MSGEKNAYETTAADATDPGKVFGAYALAEKKEAAGAEKKQTASSPPRFNRGLALKILALSFAAVFLGALIFNAGSSKKKTDGEESARAARAPSDFLRRELARGGESGGEGARDLNAGSANASEAAAAPDGGAARQGMPAVELERAYTGAPPPNIGGGNDPPQQNIPPPPPQGGSRGAPAQPAAYYASPLVPGIEGSLFAGARQTARQNDPSYAGQYPYISSAQQGQAAADDYLRRLAGISPQQSAPPPAPDPYSAQNNQSGKQSFYGSQTDPAGSYAASAALWTGTVIPGVLITPINTGLPGNVVARVTQNVYDSQTGSLLLIPQGSLLAARYNSSVSYAQRRVQIAWDSLIRPDGFQLDLGGMNGVDRQGVSGQEAEYHENWFEYAKAAGLISLFSVANAKMAEEAAKYAGQGGAESVTQANAEFVTQMGSSIVSRAMNIQPTLTVDGGTLINIMLNKTLRLPPLDGYQATKKYERE
jgi:type IV secretion system protein VirB10